MEPRFASRKTGKLTHNKSLDSSSGGSVLLIIMVAGHSASNSCGCRNLSHEQAFD